MPQRTFNHPLFGAVAFKTKNKTKWVFGDSITFLKGFDPGEVTKIHIPQLVGVPDSTKHNTGAKDGNFKFHKRGHKQLLAVFDEIERLGLLKHVKSCAGSFNMRLKKPISGKVSKDPSNHAFGIAIDLNSDDGSNGGSVAPVAPVFQKLGFLWGISFKDPMHFEIKTFIDHPKPPSQVVQVMRGGVGLDLGALNHNGHVLVDAGKAQKLFGVTRVSESASRIRFRFNNQDTLLDITLVADKQYVLLTMMAGIVGLTTKWNNATKTATLE